ncbi:MAG: phage tail sheath family protein [Aristaeellaceae bacterium]
MPINHSVTVAEQATSVTTPVIAQSGIPFAVGIAPVHTADSPATTGIPVLCSSWDECLDKLGYNEDWNEFTLCEVMYSQFVQYGMGPVIFVNLLDPSTMNESKTSSFTVLNHKINLGAKAIIDNALTVKNNSAALQNGTDYRAYYSDGELYVELLAGGTAYGASQLNVTFNSVLLTGIDYNAVSSGMEKVELCMSMFGLTPDMLLAPGFSSNSAVAAAMATKASSISGLFRAKALVDIPCDATNGAITYDAVFDKKKALAMTDKDQISCWPMAAIGDRIFHMSTQLAGAIATTDAEYYAPYASPSNHNIKIDRLCTAEGATILLSLQQANYLNQQGVVTGLNFMSSYKAWGNYTACYPDNTDVKDCFIPVSRMFDWVANSIIRTFWGHLDKPMNRRFIDTVLDSVNIWMNGLVGSGYLLGGRIEMITAENPMENLMQGIVKFHVYMTPPSPAQELDFVLEYDASYVKSSLSA